MDVFNQQETIEYKIPIQLIEYFEQDLYKQRLKIANDKNIVFDNTKSYDDINNFLKQKIDDNLLKLNLRNLNKGIEAYYRLEINFIFILSYILIKLGCKEDTETKNIICLYEINFHGINFNCQVFFENIIFCQKSQFSRITFNKEVSFQNSIFKQNIICVDFSCSNMIFFDKVKIEDTIILNYLKFDNEKSSVIFQNINYDEKKENIIKYNENSKISILNTRISENIMFNCVCIKEINFKGSDVIGTGVISCINFDFEFDNWETARIFKHEEIKKNNTIKALEYKAIEKKLYTKKLLERENKSIQEWSECFSLWISKVSNNHGQDWIKAVRFVVGSWILFFISFYNIVMFSDLIFNKCYFLNIDTFLLGISTYFNPANYDILAEYLKADYQNLWVVLLKITAIVIYILGKITIGYGIYEVIQAFRKFNTKGN